MMYRTAPTFQLRRIATQGEAALYRHDDNALQHSKSCAMNPASWSRPGRGVFLWLKGRRWHTRCDAAGLQGFIQKLIQTGLPVEPGDGSVRYLRSRRTEATGFQYRARCPSDRTCCLGDTTAAWMLRGLLHRIMTPSTEDTNEKALCVYGCARLYSGRSVRTKQRGLAIAGWGRQ